MALKFDILMNISVSRLFCNLRKVTLKHDGNSPHCQFAAVTNSPDVNTVYVAS